MNLIEQLGGYEAVKQAAVNYKNSGDRVTAAGLELQCLEYRRQHNIFEEGDKTVFVDDFMHDELMVVAWTRKGEVWMDEGAKRCTDLSMIRHATDAEIKAGRRLPV